MKIIKHESSLSKTYTFNCRKCRVVIEAEENEGRLDRRSHLDVDGSIYFHCPVCSHSICIDKFRK